MPDACYLLNSFFKKLSFFVLFFSPRLAANLRSSSFLSLGKPARRLDRDLKNEVSARLRVYEGYALAAQRELRAVLCALRNCIRYLPFERRYLYIRSERGLGEGYRHLAVDIIAVALEYRVRTDADRDDEIAVRAAVPSAVALRADRDLLTVVYTRRNRDL